MTDDTRNTGLTDSEFIDIVRGAVDGCMMATPPMHITTYKRPLAIMDARAIETETMRTALRRIACQSKVGTGGARRKVTRQDCFDIARTACNALRIDYSFGKLLGDGLLGRVKGHDKDLSA